MPYVYSVVIDKTDLGILLGLLSLLVGLGLSPIVLLVASVSFLAGRLTH